MSRRALYATTALAALALAGCASADGPADDSDGGDALTVYAGRSEDLVQPLIDDFTEETGIEVEVRYASTPEIAALLQEEGDATPADVFWSQDAGALGALADSGMLAELPADLQEGIPAEFSATDNTWVGLTGRARVIAYDSERFTAEQIPTTVADLTTPEWAGEVGFPPGNASFQSFVTAMRVLDGEEATAAWLAAMAANQPVITENNGEALDLVNSGELGAALINHYYWYERAAELGEDAMRAKLAFLPGDAGGIVNVTGAALLDGSADNEDALAFVEFLVSEDAQEYFANTTYEYPLLEGVAPSADLPPLASLAIEGLDLADLADVQESQRLIADAGLL